MRGPPPPTIRLRARSCAPAASAILALACAAPAAAQERLAPSGPLIGLPPAASVLNAPLEGPPEILPGGLGTPPGGAEAGQPALVFVPALTAQEVFTDNVLQTQHDRRSDLLTAITPSLQVNGSTSRARVNLNYAPTLELYARTHAADGVAQQLAADGSVEIVPDTFFLDARAIASVRPTTGGLGGFGFGSFDDFGAVGLGSAQPLAISPAATTIPGASTASPPALAFSRGNRSQSFSTSLTPYLVHRFGSVGTAKAGISLTETLLSVHGTEQNPIPGTLPITSQHAVTGEATVQFQTGEDFGRFRDLTILDVQRSSGSGVLSGQRSEQATTRLGYAVNRTLSVFGELGAENISYNTVQRTRIEDAIWEGGVELRPNPDSRIAIGYGHRQGATGFDVQGTYALTARTVLTVSYATQVQTDIQQLESQLGLAGFDQTNDPVNVQTGAPLFLGNGLLSLQNAVYRARNLAATITATYDRDQVSLSVQHQEQTPIGTAPGAAAGTGLSQSGVSIGGAWIHQVSDVTTLSGSASLTRTNFQQPAQGSERLVAASVGVSRALTETVSATARYSFFGRNSDFAGRSFTENLVLLGVSKRF